MRWALLVMLVGVARADADHPTTAEAVARCDKGELAACTYAGARYAEAGKPVDARGYLERGCTPKYDDGCLALGELYKSGKLPQAARLDVIARTKRACDKQVMRSCYLEAQAERGAGDATNLKSVDAANARAFPLLDRACTGKIADACDEMADVYAYGFGAPQDKAKARDYWKRACDLGDRRACLKHEHPGMQ